MRLCPTLSNFTKGNKLRYWHCWPISWTHLKIVVYMKMKAVRVIVYLLSECDKDVHKVHTANEMSTEAHVYT